MLENEKGNREHGYSTGMISAAVAIIACIVLYFGAPAIWIYPFSNMSGPVPGVIEQIFEPIDWLQLHSELYRKYLEWQLMLIDIH